MNRNLMLKVLALSLFAVMVICGFGAMASAEVVSQKSINKEDEDMSLWGEEDSKNLFWVAIGVIAVEVYEWKRKRPKNKTKALKAYTLYVFLGSFIGLAFIKTVKEWIIYVGIEILDISIYSGF